MTIEHVSDTARWVAEYRAMETDRADAIFRDPYARRLAGARGAEIVNTIPRGRQFAWPMIVRTAVLDEMILERVRAGCDMVVNLAAGLDARPWRMDLPATLRWVDVDLPGILGHKLSEMKDERPRCIYDAIVLDLADEARRRALLSQIGSQAREVLVISEGLLIYLEPDAVAGLARDLRAQPSFRWWLIDIASPRLLKFSQRSWGRSLERAPFKFAPAEDTKFFEPYGWREHTYRSIGDEARRLRREMRGMWFWRFVMRFYPRRIREQFRRFSGCVLLERV